MQSLKCFRQLTICLFVAFLFLNGCGKKEIPKSGSMEKNEAYDNKVSDPVKHKVMSFDLEGLTDSGTKKWDVKGESAEAISEDKVKLNNITASAYGEDATATITADKGIYDRTKNNVRLEENVKATIESSKENGSDFMDFSGLTKDGAGQKANVPGRSKKTKTLITCDAEVEFDYSRDVAYFSKNVHIVNDDGCIDADKVTLNLDPATKKITEIIAEGNVKIKRGDNITYSEKATYIEADKKILLTGQPKIVIYQEGKLENNLMGN